MTDPAATPPRSNTSLSMMTNAEIELAMPTTASSDREASSILKVQSFVRGALCRARVSRMVQSLIDELLVAQKKYEEEGDDESSHHLLTDSAHSATTDGQVGHRSVSDLRNSIEARTEQQQQQQLSPPISPIKSSQPVSPRRTAAAGATTTTPKSSNNNRSPPR